MAIMAAIVVDNYSVFFGFEDINVCMNCEAKDKALSLGGPLTKWCNACANSELPFHRSTIDIFTSAKVMTNERRVDKTKLYSKNISDMNNLSNDITLALNEDLDPDINMFNTS